MAGHTVISPWLSSQDAARHLGIEPDELNRLARLGHVQSEQRTRGGKRRFRAEWLDAYRQSLTDRGMTSEEAAAYLGLSVDELNRAAIAGDVQSSQRVRKGRRHYRAEWLDAYARGERPTTVLGRAG